MSAIAVTSAYNFTISGNELFGNMSFLGSRGPNCSTEDTTPNPTPFVIDRNNTKGVDVQPNFQAIPDGDGLTCIVAPDGGDYWPYRGSGSPSSSSGGDGSGDGSGAQSDNGSGGGHSSAGKTAGLVVGIIGGIALVGLLAFFLRRWAIRRRAATGGMASSDTRQYFLHKEGQ